MASVGKEGSSGRESAYDTSLCSFLNGRCGRSGALSSGGRPAWSPSATIVRPGGPGPRTRTARPGGQAFPYWQVRACAAVGSRLLSDREAADLGGWDGCHLEVWTPTGPELVALARERASLGGGPATTWHCPPAGGRGCRRPPGPRPQALEAMGSGAEGLPCVPRRNRGPSHARRLGTGRDPA